MGRFFNYALLAVEICVTLGKPAENYRPSTYEAKLAIRHVDHCLSRADRPDIYKISGSTMNESTAGICSLQLLAPQGYRIKIVFDRTVHKICQQTGVKLIFDGRDRSANNEASADSNVHSICSKSNFLEFVNLYSTSVNARIIYSMGIGLELLFSVRFVKQQLSCGDHVTAEHVGEKILLTNHNDDSSTPCRVFLPGGINLHIDQLQLRNVQQTQCRNGSFLRVRTGNDVRFLPFAANYCHKSDETDSIEIPCKVGVVELHSNSSHLETATLRFTFAPHDHVALASANCV